MLVYWWRKIEAALTEGHGSFEGLMLPREVQETLECLAAVVDTVGVAPAVIAD